MLVTAVTVVPAKCWSALYMLILAFVYEITHSSKNNNKEQLLIRITSLYIYIYIGLKCKFIWD
jgi:hypothetical protein